MNNVKLKNGTEMLEGPARGMYAILLRLFEREVIVFVELVARCRDKNHEFFGGTGERLAELKILDHTGQPHGLVKDIILSGVEGEDLAMSFGPPFEPQGPFTS